MLFQFSTGSVEDRQTEDVRVGVRNAGVQAANILCTFVKKGVDQIEEIVTQRVKVAPQVDEDIFYQADLANFRCKLFLDVDSPSLIVTVKSETRLPLYLRVSLVDTFPPSPLVEERHAPLFTACASKGAPF